MNEYINDFEKAIAKKVSKGILGRQELISANHTKLKKSRFGKVMGSLINSKTEFAIDYYGYIKKSKGLAMRLTKERKQHLGKQLKSISTTVVHFPSIKMEDVSEIMPHLVTAFPAFKKNVLIARGFKRRSR